MAALERMPQLAHLTVGRISLTDPTPGHLPSLQSLSLCITTTPQPAGVVESLLPLLPLASLTSLRCARWAASAGMTLDAIHSAHGAGPLCAALQELAAVLAAAPRLRLPRLDLCCGAFRCDLPQLAGALQPLAGRLTHLGLYMLFDTRAEWAALGRLLPGLAQLTLMNCWVTHGSLATIVALLPALGCLTLDRCVRFVQEQGEGGGPGEEEEEEAERGWAGLQAAVAEVRARRPFELCFENTGNFRPGRGQVDLKDLRRECLSWPAGVGARLEL